MMRKIDSWKLLNWHEWKFPQMSKKIYYDSVYDFSLLIGKPQNGEITMNVNANIFTI